MNGTVQHVYVSPCFLAISRNLYEKLGRPSFNHNQRGDCAEEITWRAKEQGYNVGLVYPSSVVDRCYPLDNGLSFGWGTVYGDLAYHGYCQGREGSEQMFIDKCAATPIDFQPMSEETSPQEQPPEGPFTHESIPGWFNFEDIYTEMVQTHKTGVFVEVGSWLGKSTAYMGQLLRDNPECMVDFYAVDTWKGSPGDNAFEKELEKHGGDVYGAFTENMEKCGVTEFVIPLRMSSVEAAKNFGDLSLDFVFIDADHKYDPFSADLRAWLPKVKVGGVIAGHDHEHGPIIRALSELIPGAARYKPVNKGNSWFWKVERPKGS